MNDEHVARTIHQIEGALRRDDPAFLQRMRRLERSETAVVLTVVSLLATGAVLLTVGLATLSWPAWGGGVVAFLASVLVDEHHKRHLRHPL